LPDPFGPMMACTLPAGTDRSDALEDVLVVFFQFDVQIVDVQHGSLPYSSDTAVPDTDTISMLLMTS
jgi:hypothetical protein